LARLVQQIKEPPHPCIYLPDRQASLEVKVMVDVTAAELGAMLERGWRRFGPVYFRPACEGCGECMTLRIPTATFRPTKSQRRARKNASGLVREMTAQPVVDDERLDLYARWHAHREATRGWDESPLDAERYAFDFAFQHPSVREVTFRDPRDGHLVGLGIVDEIPRALSAVYFFWDPERAPPSLGTAHIVTLVDDAAARALDHVYLGYRVAGCASLAYKGRFGPHELLEGRPHARSLPVWRPSVVAGEQG
jgi:arginine-tRNA-protein transferase